VANGAIRNLSSGRSFVICWQVLVPLAAERMFVCYYGMHRQALQVGIALGARNPAKCVIQTEEAVDM
jgi:hypothetical protein